MSETPSLITGSYAAGGGTVSLLARRGQVTPPLVPLEADGLGHGLVRGSGRYSSVASFD